MAAISRIDALCNLIFLLFLLFLVFRGRFADGFSTSIGALNNFTILLLESVPLIGQEVTEVWQNSEIIFRKPWNRGCLWNRIRKLQQRSAACLDSRSMYRPIASLIDIFMYAYRTRFKITSLRCKPPALKAFISVRSATVCGFLITIDACSRALRALTSTYSIVTWTQNTTRQSGIMF